MTTAVLLIILAAIALLLVFFLALTALTIVWFLVVVSTWSYTGKRPKWKDYL